MMRVSEDCALADINPKVIITLNAAKAVINRLFINLLLAAKSAFDKVLRSIEPHCTLLHATRLYCQFVLGSRPASFGWYAGR
jgi:hypothetical protein